MKALVDKTDFKVKWKVALRNSKAKGFNAQLIKNTFLRIRELQLKYRQQHSSEHLHFLIGGGNIMVSEAKKFKEQLEYPLRMYRTICSDPNIEEELAGVVKTVERELGIIEAFIKDKIGVSITAIRSVNGEIRYTF